MGGEQIGGGRKNGQRDASEWPAGEAQSRRENSDANGTRSGTTSGQPPATDIHADRGGSSDGQRSDGFFRFRVPCRRRAGVSVVVLLVPRVVVIPGPAFTLVAVGSPARCRSLGSRHQAVDQGSD